MSPTDAELKPRSWQELAAEQITARDYKSAEALLRSVLEDEPGNVEARVNLGALLLISGVAQEAVHHLVAAFEAAPESGAAIANLVTGPQ